MPDAHESSEFQPPPRFEHAIEQLEAMIEAIETGEIGLEESLKQYEQGARLIAHCRSILNRAETRIATLTEDAEGMLSIDEAEAATGDDPE